MRIGIVLPGHAIDPAYQKAQVYRQLIQLLTVANEVYLFLTSPLTTLPGLDSRHVEIIDASSRLAGGMRWWNVSRRILNSIPQHTPLDVLHAIGADLNGVVAIRAGQKYHLPVVVSVREDELVGYPDIGYGMQRSAIGRQVVRYALTRATIVVVSSAYMRQLASQHLSPSQLAHLREIPLGVDTEHFIPPQPGLSTRHREYVHVGALTPVKDQTTLLDLMASLPLVTLDIIGDGPLRSQLEARADALGLSGRVRFHGWVGYERLPAFYQSARFLLVTSRHEAFCLPAVEALACGTGVIGTAVGVLPEVGLTVPTGDVEALQTTIVRRPRKHGHVQRAQYRLLAEHVYSLSHMRDGMLSAYAAAIQRQRGQISS
ncbi:MAG: glycosyltransferase family 4 protein [Chloroflexi bacterium]|nr:glycosyltransferase family 4 protein [Chloroflexota bacterium]